MIPEAAYVHSHREKSGGGGAAGAAAAWREPASRWRIPAGRCWCWREKPFGWTGRVCSFCPASGRATAADRPCPLAARTGHPEDTVVSVGKARIGRDFCLIAGPCAVESSEQVTSIARQVSAAGAPGFFAEAAFKPRPPIPLEGWGPRGWSCCAVRAGRRACRWCRRSPIPGSCRCSGR